MLYSHLVDLASSIDPNPSLSDAPTRLDSFKSLQSLYSPLPPLRLNQHGHKDWLVCDMAEEAGGLACTDVTKEGFLFDMGGHGESKKTRPLSLPAGRPQ